MHIYFAYICTISRSIHAIIHSFIHSFSCAACRELRVSYRVCVASSVPLTSSICCEALPGRQTDRQTDWQLLEVLTSVACARPFSPTHFNSLFRRPVWNSYYLSFIHTHTCMILTLFTRIHISQEAHSKPAQHCVQLDLDYLQCDPDC